MYPILVLAVAILLSTWMTGITGQNRDLTKLYQSRLRHIQLVVLAENIEQFTLENTNYPAHIDVLAATAGFEQSRSYINNWQGYAISPVITDSIWKFNRAVLFSNDPSRGVTAVDYLNLNACGVGSFDTAISWCGTSTSLWFRSETREQYNTKISTQRIRMGRLLQKFATYYNNNGNFPDKNALNVALSANSIQTLASLASYSGSAKTCSGTFQYHGIPIDCGDMFDLWGGTIGYQFTGPKRIILTSETPIFNALGNRIVVASEIDNSLL